MVAGRVPLPAAVLFACTTNAVRSPMAAAILRHLAGRRMYVASAGVREGLHDAFVDVVMGEIGIDVSQHQPNTLGALGDTSFDLIVTLSPEAAPLPPEASLPAPIMSPPPPLIREVAETSVPCSWAMTRSTGPPGAN